MRERIFLVVVLAASGPARSRPRTRRASCRRRFSSPGLIPTRRTKIPCKRIVRRASSSRRRAAEPDSRSKKDGKFIDHPIAPTDGNETVPGKWEPARERGRSR